MQMWNQNYRCKTINQCPNLKLFKMDKISFAKPKTPKLNSIVPHQLMQRFTTPTKISLAKKTFFQINWLTHPG